jgi:GNAT superfamily N-acetyltransferase
MTIATRPATADDVPALLALYAGLHPDDPPVPADQAASVWRQIADHPGRTVLVAVLDDAVVGTVDCVVLPNLTRGARPFMLLENVVVAADRRREGVGRTLLMAAGQVARSTNCYKMQLLSRVDRIDAHAFYESCGFRPVAQGYRSYLDQVRGGGASPDARS